MSVPHVSTRPANLIRVAETLNNVIDGKLNVVGTLKLTAGATTTVVNDNLFESQQVPLLIPQSANAAAALATTYLSARDKGSFTLTHANAGTTDRDFLYIRLG